MKNINFLTNTACIRYENRRYTRSAFQTQSDTACPRIPITVNKQKLIANYNTTAAMLTHQTFKKI